MNGRLALPMAITAAMLLSACASSSGVTELGQDTYMMTVSSIWRGNDGVAAQGLRRAEAYCQAKGGKHMRIVGSERSDGLPVVLPPKALLTFKCDPAR